MDNFEAMMAAGDFLPAHVKPWAMWMQIALMLGPILFVRYAAARWLLGAQVVNFLIAYGVFVAEGNEVTRLFGLGHVAWILPLWLLARDTQTDKWLPYRIYAGVAALTICISLVFDVRDIYLWLEGDRGSVLVGAP